jgi:hypothetical protein
VLSFYDFTVFVEGVDLVARETIERLDTAGSQIGGEGFEDAVFGRARGRQFAVFESEAASYDLAVQNAVTRLSATLPDVRIVAVEPGRFGSMDIR